MGRYFAQSDVALTSKQKALQNGTPKWMPDGSPRACYGMISYNTSSNGYHVAFYDKYFQAVTPNSYPGNASTFVTTGVPNLVNLHNGVDAATASWMIGHNGNMPSSQSTMSSNSIGYNGMNLSGEFGAAYTDLFSNGTISSPFLRDLNTWNKAYANSAFFNSDHTDRAYVYLLHGSRIRAVGRVDGSWQFNYPDTKDYLLTGLTNISSMWGSASYNNVRKELVVFSYNGSGGAFQVRIYKGINFDKYPSPADAFAAADVTVVDKTVASTPSWGSNNGDAYYCGKPVLCDDGSIFLTAFHEGSSFNLYKYTRDASDNLTATFVANKSTTTSYGHSQGVNYSQKSIQARDGGAVMSYCPYYYYGCGLRSYVIDKRKSTYFDPTMFDGNSTGQGIIPVPYGDSGFAAYSAGNVYAGNPTGAYITGFVERVGTSGNLAQSGTSVYLPYFTLPNTANYPGFTQVTDYSMLDNQFVA